MKVLQCVQTLHTPTKYVRITIASKGQHFDVAFPPLTNMRQMASCVVCLVGFGVPPPLPPQVPAPVRSTIGLLCPLRGDMSSKRTQWLWDIELAIQRS